MLTQSKGFEKRVKLNVTNSIQLHDEITDEKLGKGRKFVSRFIEPGMVYYKEFGDVLITKETLDKFIDTMVGCPVIINHKDITNNNVDDERVGVVSRVWYNPDDNFFYCEGIIWDKEAIDLVKKKGWNVSCSYDFQSDFESKTHNGKKIDCTFTDGNFLHLALVDNPRYERANIVVNSADEENNNTERKENTVMTALNELEKFVRNIVENACKNEEKEEEKVENADKRKLIDEIGGILKGKVDDEIIRTIMQKAEELAYEKSEAGSADNKCKNADEEEKEEKFEEEKEIAENKKAKNEEEDEEEVELEEEVENKKAKNEEEEKEVDNKCKNVKNSIIDKANKIVYNGSNEVRSSYISRADRIELGNNY